MSTRSTIGILDEKTQMVRGVYCHSDGYISHNGVLLDCFYKDVNKIMELLNTFNALSSLGIVTDNKKAGHLNRNAHESHKEYYNSISQYIYTKGELKGASKGKGYDETIICPLEKFLQEDYAYVYYPTTNKWWVIGGAYNDWVPLHRAIKQDIVYKNCDMNLGAQNTFKILQFKESVVPQKEYSVAKEYYVKYCEYITKLAYEIMASRNKYTYDAFYKAAKEKSAKYKAAPNIVTYTITDIDAKYNSVQVEMKVRRNYEIIDTFDYTFDAIDIILASTTNVPIKMNRQKMQVVLNNPSLLKQTHFFNIEKGLKKPQSMFGNKVYTE